MDSVAPDCSARRRTERPGRSRSPFPTASFRISGRRMTRVVSRRSDWRWGMSFAGGSSSNLQPVAFPLALAHANIVRHPAFRRAASRKLFRDDEAGHRTAGPGRGVLFHRELSLDDLAVRGGTAAQEYARCGARFPRLRARSDKISLLQTVRCAGSHGTDLVADDGDAD